MRIIRFKIPLIALALNSILMLVLSLGTAGSALACSGDSCSPSDTVNGGSLTPAFASDLALNSSNPITLTGQYSTYTYASAGSNPLITANDSTGNDAGWSLALGATAFKSGTHTLSNASIDLTVPASGFAKCDADTESTPGNYGTATCVLPGETSAGGTTYVCTNSSFTSGTLTALTSAGTQVLCATGTGAGSTSGGIGNIDFSPTTLALVLPANVTFASPSDSGTTFSSTITLTMAALS